MEPSTAFTWLAMPEEPDAAWPPGAGHFFSASYFQSLGAAAFRYLPRFCVVPESSERWKAWIGLSGSFAPSLSLAIAGSFHFLIFVSKILARVGASSVSLSTPSRWKPTAIGPPTIGRLIPWPVLQIFFDSATSSGFRAESEPAKPTVPWLKATMPSPDEEEL